MTASASPGQSTFRPWTSNLVLLCYGLICAWMAYHFLFTRGHLVEFAGALAVCFVFIAYQWRQLSRRTWGQRVEVRAINELRTALDRIEGTAISSGVKLPYGGDADAVVILDGVRFNLEIKSIENPSKVTAGHAKQAQKAGEALMSIPVIWLPGSKRKEARQQRGVHVVAGNSKDLIKFLRMLR